MGKRESLVGKVILKFVATDEATVYYPYIDAVDPNDGGWDTYARQRTSRPFDTVKEARAWVTSLSGPREMCAHCALMGYKIAYRRIIARKARNAT